MDRKGTDAERRAQCVEMKRKQRISRFRLSVSRPLVIVAALEIDIVEVEAIARMANRRQRNNARAGACRLEQRPQPRRHLKMAEMVCRKLAFIAARIPCQRVGHDRGIVDQDVDLCGVCRHIKRKRIDRRRVAKVQRQDRHAIDPRQISGGGIGPSRADDDCRAGPRQRADRFEAKPRIAAGDERGLPGQVNARNDVGRGGAHAESAADGCLIGHVRALPIECAPQAMLATSSAPTA